MLALRALLFAVFGGFIGAAPAAPVVPDRAGHDAPEADAAQQSQKSEHPVREAEAPTARDRAAAPPSADTVGSAIGALPSERLVFRLPEPVAGSSGPSRGATPLPPVEDIRAGLLDLPPPPR
jgi:hypothetical protein